jgi:hypothetical protein
MMNPPQTSDFEVISEENNAVYVDAVQIEARTGMSEFRVHKFMAKLKFHPAAYIVDLTKGWAYKKVYLPSQVDALVAHLMLLVKYEERCALLRKMEARLK